MRQSYVFCTHTAKSEDVGLFPRASGASSVLARQEVDEAENANSVEMSCLC